MNTGARNPGDGRDGTDSVGIGQWNGSRAKALYAFGGDKANNLDTQLDFAIHEMKNGPERSVWEKLQAAEDVHGATKAMISYERPAGWKADNPTAGHGWDNRLSWAGEVLGMSPDEIAAANATSANQVANARPTLLNTEASATASTETADAQADDKPLFNMPKVLPDEIFGVNTAKGGKLLSAFSDMMQEQTDKMNEAVPKGGRANAAPVEITMASSMPTAPQQQGGLIQTSSSQPNLTNMEPWELMQMMMRMKGRGRGGLI